MSIASQRNVLGPLTTPFTFPAGCSNLALNQGGGQTVAWQAQTCLVEYVSPSYLADALSDDANCWPPATVTTPTGALLGWGFYSPGLSCPTGWTSACTAAMMSGGQSPRITDGTSFSFQFSLTAGETAVGCCPRYENESTTFTIVRLI